MAKTRSPKAPKPVGQAKAAGPSEVVVDYDLFDLPTAFHKAGLAGLVLLIESLKDRQVLTEAEAKCEVTATRARVTFTESLICKLMDDVYDAERKEVAVKDKWDDTKVSRPPTDAEKEAGARFVYCIVQPKGAFFDNVFDGEKEIWRKLWRDVMWNILRGRHTMREPYNERAAGQSCKEGPNAWGDLVKVCKARANSCFHTAPLSSALFPGAQAVNAEVVKFEGCAEQNILLHFWPLTVLMFVPQEVERDGTTSLPPLSCSLAIPEVSNLTEFIRDYPKLLESLAGRARAYRPAESVIDLPAEGALAFLEDLAVLTGLLVETGELRFSIAGAEYLHLFKKGNNVKAMAAGRVSPNRCLLVGYRAIACPQDESTRYRNPLFRRGLLEALLDDLPWYQAFGRTFSIFDAGVFLRQPPRGGGEPGPPLFAADAAKKFRHETRLFTQTLERDSEMSGTERQPAPLSVLVEQVIRSYLLGKAKAKCNLSAGTKMSSLAAGQKKEVYEKKRLVAKETFLAVRARRDADFVSYFSSVICSAGTYFDRKSPDFQAFATALTDPGQTETIKNLTLLSLSANS